MSQAQGRVKAFDEQNGIGIICGRDGRHFFVRTGVTAGGSKRTLAPGDVVEFDWETGAVGFVATRVNVRELVRH